MAGKISDLVTGAPAIVSDLAADTAALEASIDVTTVPESKGLTLGVLRDWLAGAATGFAAVAVTVLALTAATPTLELGTAALPITTVIIGNGDTAISPAARTLRFTNASGVDNEAGAVTEQLPFSTGTKIGGAYHLVVGLPGASGAGLNEAYSAFNVTPVAAGSAHDVEIDFGDVTSHGRNLGVYFNGNGAAPVTSGVKTYVELSVPDNGDRTSEVQLVWCRDDNFDVWSVALLPNFTSPAQAVTDLQIYVQQTAMDPLTTVAAFTQAGQLRTAGGFWMKNAQSLVGRNQAGDADLTLVGIDASDRVTLGYPGATFVFGGLDTVASPPATTQRYTNASGVDNVAGDVIHTAPLNTGAGVEGVSGEQLLPGFIWEGGQMGASGAALQTPMRLMTLTRAGPASGDYSEGVVIYFGAGDPATFQGVDESTFVAFGSSLTTGASGRNTTFNIQAPDNGDLTGSIHLAFNRGGTSYWDMGIYAVAGAAQAATDLQFTPNFTGISTFALTYAGQARFYPATAATPALSFGPNAAVQTTVGAAGGADAQPLTPLGYFLWDLHGTPVAVPYHVAA